RGRHRNQHDMSRPDRNSAARRTRERRRLWCAGGTQARTRDADAATRTTRRLSGRGRVLVERRCGVHHRPNLIGFRWSDHARLKDGVSNHDGFATMELKVLFTVFATVFVAELGDKTQLATMLYAADKEVSKWTVFLGASLALVCTSGLGVLVGSAISDYV